MCAVFNSLSCFFDLHIYQKREIEDTFTELFHAKTNLLIDGMLVGNYSLPITNNEFKFFLRDFYTRPVILKDFSLDINPIQTNVTCKISYNNCAIISKPLFSFSNQMLQDVELIKKQLKNINFSYKLSKTHLYFQVMESNIETEFRFYYNDSTDKYSSDGMSYSRFLTRYASVIGSRVPLPEVLPGQPQSLAPVVALPPPQPSLHQDLSLQTSTSVASAHETPRSRPRRLYPDLEDLNLTTSRPSVQGPIARLGTKNHRIIQDLAEEMEVKFDTDMLKKELKKNTSLYYMMMHGVIPLIDKRVQEQDETEEVTDNILDSENVDENSTRE
jgi:hypothetical protein